jgi:hypothetical protein
MLRMPHARPRAATNRCAAATTLLPQEILPDVILRSSATKNLLLYLLRFFLREDFILCRFRDKSLGVFREQESFAYQ